MNVPKLEQLKELPKDLRSLPKPHSRKKIIIVGIIVLFLLIIAVSLLNKSLPNFSRSPNIFNSNKSDFRPICAQYTIEDTTITACATCGNNICEGYENCTPSNVDIMDCGALYCPGDCGITPIPANK